MCVVWVLCVVIVVVVVVGVVVVVVVVVVFVVWLLCKGHRHTGDHYRLRSEKSLASAESKRVKCREHVSLNVTILPASFILYNM